MRLAVDVIMFFEVFLYICEFYGCMVVIKYGGVVMNDFDLCEDFVCDVVFFKYVGMNSIVVYGGGLEIMCYMEWFDLLVEFVGVGVRVG